MCMNIYMDTRAGMHTHIDCISEVKKSRCTF